MAVCLALAQTKPSPKVLLIPREGRSNDLELMLTKEVGVMVGMLEKAGFDVEVATASGAPIVAETSTLKPNLKLWTSRKCFWGALWNTLATACIHQAP